VAILIILNLLGVDSISSVNSGNGAKKN
jgi:hypothetical protein